jgi:SOS regulatory protein LexA
MRSLLLYQMLNNYFNKSELHGLCFELKIDYENLSGKGKSDKVRELIEYCRRHGITDKLINKCSELRPNVPWSDCFINGPRIEGAVLRRLEEQAATLEAKEFFRGIIDIAAEQKTNQIQFYAEAGRIDEIRRIFSADIQTMFNCDPPLLVSVRGEIAAGFPRVYSEDTSGIEAIEVPYHMVPPQRLQDVFALWVRGDSMMGALICPGDCVLLLRQETAENGQIVAVRIEDEDSLTLKRFYREGDQVRLQPVNEMQNPIFVHAANVRIQARVIGFLPHDLVRIH